ncbi:terminase large subunit domain-containing protein [Microbispora sp. KK1-11]|uniref:terminase large subunit domain-containing protein n=1 Tax=Microbispora sp. KK1-11 TaxID=2053005 RepID=UPI0011581683|nr:terminase family protein [Microbispora sp. KK1-11]TQS29140.1 terminase [Microbispora sp. KK1-11]
MTTSETWQIPPEFAEQCRELYGLECPPLWGTPRRPDRPSLGPKAWKVMERLGYPPMPWQKYVLDVALEIDPDTGVFSYREVGLSVPRQQGKTQQILGLMVHRIAAWHRQRVVYAAQTRGMARERFEDEFLVTLDESSLAGKYRTRMSNGNEAIIWSKTRSKLGITANTEKAGHGPPLDLGVIDEAFAHEDDRLEQAFSPAMLTRDMAQLWWASAGGTEKSVWLNKKRAAGRELVERLWETGEHSRIAYFEWFAPDELPRDDPETWRTCLPALGHTVTEDTIRAELDKLDPAEFDRAYLNRTRKQVPPQDPNIPVKAWAGLADADSQAGRELAFVIEVAHDRAWSSIGLAALRDDGRVHLEVVDRHPGTDWAVPAIVRLRALWDPVAVAVASTGSPAGSLIDDLVAAGVTTPKDKDRPMRGDLIVMRTGDIVEACGQMADAINQGTVVHRDQAELTAAVNGARTRPFGDAWALDRRRSLVDVSPFFSVTLARWVLLIIGPQVSRDYDPLDSVY